ncbi:MAG TPA: AlkA N-terminal domain-containing protein [Thermomicrobiales bacterium]|jgi:AraC family transcriptional regulator of adaptative response / DNA-3-methyladenine glycosylase II|nr:AlkA N-terminal domain-containing protein [Thermomicrobiales bacterium]
MEHDADTLYRAYRTRDPRFDGRVFAGVRTTGIYCRPVCPARLPLRENMTFFPTAAAAQSAGYRPCLRCRPEASPDLAGWRGTSPVVARALALIDEGLLEDAAIEDLAARVGVSDRQLRRLFREYLGATPVTVAQNRRILLARQLIGQTDLGMADIAMASGFGSVRRFNETFRQLFGRPPGELRRHRAPVAATETTPGTDLTVTLPYRPPYDWPGMLARLGRTMIPGLEAIDGDGYLRAVRFGDTAGAIIVRPAPGRRRGDGLQLTVAVPRLDVLPRLIARTRRLLDLPADPDAIGAALSEDQALAPLIAARPGLRVPGMWDPFERAVRTTLGDDPVALGWLVASAGPPVPPECVAWTLLRNAFPTPDEILARLGRGTGDGQPGVPALPGALPALARAAIADPRLFDGVADRVAARLGAVPGIDPDLARTLATRLADETDVLDPTDPALLSAARAAGIPGGSPAALADHTRAWSPFRTYAAAHLLAAADP